MLFGLCDTNRDYVSGGRSAPRKTSSSEDPQLTPFASAGGYPPHTDAVTVRRPAD